MRSVPRMTMSVRRLHAGYAATRRYASGARRCAAMALMCAILAGCTGEPFQKGYILPPGALEQIPIGASQDQVLIVMGTPSTVATLNGEVFYYISQRAGAQGRLHAAEGHRSARDRDLFRQEPPGRRGSPITACRTARSSTSSAAPRRHRARRSAISHHCLS